MLEVDVVMEESYDEERNHFAVKESFKVRLEHSLVSASKWESLWKVPFISKQSKTPQQLLSYVKFMILDDELPPGVFKNLVENHMEQIQAYIGNDMTATKIYSDPNAPQSRETITTELIYYWMISMRIPVEFQDWHLNRLITLIRTINLKNSPKKKMGLSERRAINRARLAKYNTKG